MERAIYLIILLAYSLLVVIFGILFLLGVFVSPHAILSGSILIFIGLITGITMIKIY